MNLSELRAAVDGMIVEWSVPPDFNDDEWWVCNVCNAEHAEEYMWDLQDLLEFLNILGFPAPAVVYPLRQSCTRNANTKPCWSGIRWNLLVKFCFICLT